MVPIELHQIGTGLLSISDPIRILEQQFVGKTTNTFSNTLPHAGERQSAGRRGSTVSLCEMSLCLIDAQLSWGRSEYNTTFDGMRSCSSCLEAREQLHQIAQQDSSCWQKQCRQPWRALVSACVSRQPAPFLVQSQTVRQTTQILQTAHGSSLPVVWSVPRPRHSTRSISRSRHSVLKRSMIL